MMVGLSVISRVVVTVVHWDSEKAALLEIVLAAE